MFQPAPALPTWLDALLPLSRRGYALQRGTDRGRRLHLIDHGQGRPVVLVHGNPTWSFLWRRVIAGLDGFRCVAPDLLGFGLSDKPERLSDHTVERHVEAQAELVEALDLRDIILVAQDWGGPIAAGVGALLPDRVAGLVLGNTSVLVPRKPRGTAFHRFAHLPGVSDLVFRGLGFPQRGGLTTVQGDPRSLEGVVGRAYRWPLRRLRDRAGPLALARMVPNGPRHPSLPALARGEAWARGFAGPVALVWGERDPILGRALRRHVEAFPEARVTRSEAGHFLQEEVPALIVDAVRAVDG